MRTQNTITVVTNPSIFTPELKFRNYSIFSLFWLLRRVVIQFR
ncbi:hypothetical protein CAMGR0001_0831 [Campylobacter gracilis RM3268]|uniref:Uncharacterized protein n=1 Tax=Campylobacter gracilis RM3268 TaxID=553220 RepID=C8PG38_9BACT|nr:hypothetical protein CAMGR0001_0831 [Campylobacter gracilis RM3268]